ncbi:MAG: family phosphatase [Sphingomonas bacterium]|nr:family phosphatase [Sphingomonas bacterium]
MRFAAILFDFDGVLVESEYAGNRHIAEYLTGIGHPTTPEDSMAHYMGLAGREFIEAIEQRIGRTLPEDFYTVREIENQRMIAQGVDAVAGAVAFVRGLPADLPRAICSSSSTDWITAHLRHIGLADAFGAHLYSGREHVANGKPAPDLYLYAAKQLGVPIERCVVIEDSPVGARGAVASGAFVIGLCAGTHCGIGHADRLLALGVDAVAADFAEVAALVA